MGAAALQTVDRRASTAYSARAWRSWPATKLRPTLRSPGLVVVIGHHVVPRLALEQTDVVVRRRAGRSSNGLDMKLAISPSCLASSSAAVLKLNACPGPTCRRPGRTPISRSSPRSRSWRSGCRSRTTDLVDDPLDHRVHVLRTVLKMYTRRTGGGWSPRRADELGSIADQQLVAELTAPLRHGPDTCRGAARSSIPSSQWCRRSAAPSRPPRDDRRGRADLASAADHRTRPPRCQSVPETTSERLSSTIAPPYMFDHRPRSQRRARSGSASSGSVRACRAAAKANVANTVPRQREQRSSTLTAGFLRCRRRHYLLVIELRRNF